MMNQLQYSSGCSSTKIDRKTKEKNRRDHMKALFSNLKSLLPPHQSSREVASLPDQLEEAINYIKKLQIKLERMREKKDNLMMRVAKATDPNYNNNAAAAGLLVGGLNDYDGQYPQIEIREFGNSALEVVLITRLDGQYMFNESIRVLHEEGADIVNATFSAVEDTIFHIIHSQIGKSEPTAVAAKISQRLGKFVNGPS